MSGPIEHVVLIIKENHTFDNYFGTYPNPGGHARGDLPKFTNPWPGVIDLKNNHAAWMKRHKPSPLPRDHQFTGAHIPAYFSYADQFTLCDEFFAEITGASKPNHVMLMAGETPFLDAHAGAPVPGQPFALPSLPQALDAAGQGYTWGFYGSSYTDLIQYLVNNPQSVHLTTQFEVDVRAQNLPTVSYLMSTHELSEHQCGTWDQPASQRQPGVIGDVKKGSNWTADQVNLLVQNGYWNNTVIFITWDDWGGWYDSVDPLPVKETWAGPLFNPGFLGDPFRYGSRVGCLVLSPYAKHGYISHTLHSHVSLLKFCIDTFGLNASTWNQRVQNADGMADCFEFNTAAKGPPTYIP